MILQKLKIEEKTAVSEGQERIFLEFSTTVTFSFWHEQSIIYFSATALVAEIKNARTSKSESPDSDFHRFAEVFCRIY